MKKIIVVMLIILFTVLSACGTQVPAEKTAVQTPVPSAQPSAESAKPAYEAKSVEFKSYALSELLEDFDQVRSLIMSENPLVFADQEALSKVFEQQRPLLRDGMEELDLYRILAPAMAQIKCGHTSLNFSDAYSAFNKSGTCYLPLDVRIVGDKPYIIEDLGDNGIPAGSELVSINKRPAAEIVSGLIADLSSDGDNLTRKYYVLNHWFSGCYADFIEHADTFEVEYKDSANGSTARKTIKGITRDAVESGNAAPQADPYSLEIADNKYAFLTIKSFAFYDNKGRLAFQKFIDDSFRQINDNKINQLVLDLRDNWGGDPFCSSYLFQSLISEPTPYFAEGALGYGDLTVPLGINANHFTGSLYVLTNGASFSSTGHLCALLKYCKLGTFIGEETGGSFICTDGSRDVVLKNTGMKLHYSTMAYQVAVRDMALGRGITPDYAVEASLNEILEGKDPVMEKALELIDKVIK